MSAGEAGRHHVAARLGRLGEGVHDAADLGRHQDLVALGAPQARAHPRFRESVAVVRRGVEHLDAARERLLDRRDRRFFVEQLIEIAKRPGPLADDGERQPLAVPSLYASRFHVASKSVPSRQLAMTGPACFMSRSVTQGATGAKALGIVASEGIAIRAMIDRGDWSFCHVTSSDLGSRDGFPLLITWRGRALGRRLLSMAP